MKNKSFLLFLGALVCFLLFGCQKQTRHTTQIITKDTVIVDYGNEDVIGKDSNTVYIHYFEKLFSDSYKGLDVDIIRDKEVRQCISMQYGEDVYNKLLDQHCIAGRAEYDEENHVYVYGFAQPQSFNYNEGSIIYYSDKKQLEAKLIVDGEEVDLQENLIDKEAKRLKTNWNGNSYNEFFCYDNIGTKISLDIETGMVTIKSNIGSDSPYYLDTDVNMHLFNKKGKKLSEKHYTFERVNKSTVSISLYKIPESDAIPLMCSFVKMDKNQDPLKDRIYGYTKVWYRLSLDLNSEDAATLNTSYHVESCTYSNYYE